jgi:hypothetical protein
VYIVLGLWEAEWKQSIKQAIELAADRLKGGRVEN